MVSTPAELADQLRAEATPLAMAAAAEIERLRGEVARLEAVITLQQGTMHRRQTEHETISFEWNVPPSGPGHDDTHPENLKWHPGNVSRETPEQENQP